MQKVILTGRAVIVQDKKILLVSKDKSFWVLPGGIAEKDENIEECIERELYEELGLSVRVLNLLYVTEFEDSKFKNKKIELFFKCKILKGVLDENWQDPDGIVKFAKFFSLEELNDITYFPRFLKENDWLKEPSKNVYKGIFHR